MTGIVLLMMVAREPLVRAQPEEYFFNNLPGNTWAEPYGGAPQGETFVVLYLNILTGPVNILFLDNSNYNLYLYYVTTPASGSFTNLWTDMGQAATTTPVTVTFSFDYVPSEAPYHLVFDNTGWFNLPSDYYPCYNSASGAEELVSALYEPLYGYVYQEVGTTVTTTPVPNAAITLSGVVGASLATCSVTYYASADATGFYSASANGYSGVPYGSYTATISAPGYITTTDAFTATGQQEDLPILTVVPEFSSFLFLPLFMIATLLVAIIYRRQFRKENASA
jgi:hypothetical protein